MKTCTKCRGEGPFYKDRKQVDGLSVWCAECMRVQTRRYRANNPEQVKAATKAWVRANPQKKAQTLRRWKKNNPEKDRQSSLAVHRRRRARLRGVATTLTAAQWKETLEYFNYACAYCLRTDAPLEMDHVVPVSRGGEHVQENVVPACKSCNVSKLDRPVWAMVA
jgi:5-methylcytosine-specific restriction endonuclease McrA